MSAHVLGWLQGERRLSVLTLPGTEVEGLVGFRHARGHGVDIEASSDREVVLVEPGAARVLFREAPWGDLLVVGSYGQPQPLDVLRAVADSVQPIDAGAWKTFLVEATGGPHLAPDPGFVEVARGQHGDESWLLQASDASVDEGVKLGNQRRVCADDGRMGNVDCGDRPVPPTLVVVRADVVAADGSTRCLRM